MMDWRKLWKKLKNPSLRILLCVWIGTAFAIAGALALVIIGYAGWLSYPVYAVAACTLGYTVYTIVRFAPNIKSGVQGALKSKKFTRKLTENYTFRTLVFATCSAIINLGFVAFNTVFSVLTGNGWYASLAGYYFLLCVLRGLVFWWNRRAKARADGDEREYRRLQRKNYGYCGIFLLLLDIALSVAVTFMVLDRKPTTYTEITAIVFAAFSVYKISLAVYNVFKARKTRDMQIQSFRNIGLIDGAVSLLSLQVTLIATFSVGEQDMGLLNAMTGAFVCLLSIGLAILMIIKAYRKKNYEICV